MSLIGRAAGRIMRRVNKFPKASSHRTIRGTRRLAGRGVVARLGRRTKGIQRKYTVKIPGIGLPERMIVNMRYVDLYSQMDQAPGAFAYWSHVYKLNHLYDLDQNLGSGEPSNYGAFGTLYNKYLVLSVRGTIELTHTEPSAVLFGYYLSTNSSTDLPANNNYELAEQPDSDSKLTPAFTGGNSMTTFNFKVNLAKLSDDVKQYLTQAAYYGDVSNANPPTKFPSVIIWARRLDNANFANHIQQRVTLNLRVRWFDENESIA